jgi:hypothetical protein
VVSGASFGVLSVVVVSLFLGVVLIVSRRFATCCYRAVYSQGVRHKKQLSGGLFCLLL